MLPSRTDLRIVLGFPSLPSAPSSRKRKELGPRLFKFIVLCYISLHCNIQLLITFHCYAGRLKDSNARLLHSAEPNPEGKYLCSGRLRYELPLQPQSRAQRSCSTQLPREQSIRRENLILQFKPRHLSQRVLQAQW